MLGRNCRKNCEKRFLYSHEYRYQKIGGKKRAKHFSRNTRIVREKNDGKKINGKSAKNVFLYSHQYRNQKIGGTKRAKQFFQKHTISARKKYLEKNRRKKVRKTFFYILTNIVTKKWGEKTRETIFPGTHV